MVHEGRGHALSSADCGGGGFEISHRVYVQAGWAPQVIKTEKKPASPATASSKAWFLAQNVSFRRLRHNN